MRLKSCRMNGDIPHRSRTCAMRVRPHGLQSQRCAQPRCEIVSLHSRSRMAALGQAFSWLDTRAFCDLVVPWGR